MADPGVRNMLTPARELAEMTPWELWLAYFSLGGTASAMEVEAHVQGRDGLDDLQHDIIVQALNERFLDRDMDHPVPYAHERPTV